MSRKNTLKQTEKSSDRRRKYIYKQLRDCSIGDQCNFYAVVLDATFPHKSNKSDRFICTVKVADLSSRFNNKGIVDFVSVVFFANSFDELPIC